MAWNRKLSRFLLLVFFFGARLNFAQESRPVIGPPASWVNPLVFNPRFKLDPVDPTTEMRYVLSDHQLNAQSNETFVHEVRQVLNLTGVRNNSHVSVDFDPSFQLLTFHWVRVWRGTNHFEHLNPSQIQINQHGLDLDELFLSGEKSALILLEDVRPGDIIEYAYTLHGENPVFRHQFFDYVTVQSAYPMDRAVTRLLWPPSRRFYIKNHATDIQPIARRSGEFAEYIWDEKKVPARHLEPGLPSGYFPFAWVELSEFQNWAQVNQWDLGLFTSTNSLSAGLTRQIAEWKRITAPEQRIVTALRFVQDEIRYLSFGGGALGYEPASPGTVFDRRYGDCKDKTLLFVTILRALGIEAYPALVNTKMRQSIAELHAAAPVFDHAITQVMLQGQTYWLDCTANYERGPLSLRYWAPYGYALIIRPGTKGLTPIQPSLVVPVTTMTEYLALGDLDHASELKTVTVFEGSDATETRARYATTAHEDLEREDLNALARLYPDIQQTQAQIYFDDEERNRIEVTSFYAIQRIWSRSSAESYYHCRLYPINVDEVMNPPSVSLRTMPLGLSYPLHRIFRAEVMVPTASPNGPENQVIENPAFYFRQNVTVSRGKLMLEYEYRSLTDTVLPDAVPAYVLQLGAALDLSGYTISSD